MEKLITKRNVRVTRKISDAELSKRLQGCPWCGGKVITRERFVRDRDTAKMKPGGTFFGCQNFPKTGCDYWVSLDGTEKLSAQEILETEDAARLPQLGL